MNTLRLVAPLRIDIAGGITDIPLFSETVGTCITNFAIDLYEDSMYQKQRQLKIKVHYSPINVLRYNGKSLQEQVRNAETKLVYECIKYFLRTHPLHKTYTISIEDTLPKRTGLGGSAGLTTALFTILHTLKKKEEGNDGKIQPSALLKEAHHFEVNIMGVTGGFQDFIASYFGNLNYIIFRNLEDKSIDNNTHLGNQIEPRMRTYLDQHMYVVLIKNNNIPSNIIVDDEISTYKREPQIIYKKLHHILKCNIAAYSHIQSNGNLQERLTSLGRIMEESWNLQKTLSDYICTGTLRTLESQLLPYVYGLRGPGAGGNSLFLIAKPNVQNEIISLVDKYNEEIELFYVRINTTGMKIK